MQHHSHKTTFRLSHTIIWVSSLFIGILASVPKILRLHIELGELLIDISIASSFSVFVWYYNIYNLPKFVANKMPVRFAGRRLLKSLVIGMLVMVCLVLIHQLCLPKYHFQSMMLMYEFRGLVINLTIYLFLHLLYQGYISQAMTIELEKTKADNLNAQFELLKQQVNPHFLFNSLNTLKSMVDMNDKNASQFIVMLSDFYRFSLEKKKKDLIRLCDEIETLQAYLFLLHARFEDGIRVDINVDETQRQSFIPPFTLQLLAENCIKHNIVSLEHPLQIRIYSDKDHLVVENNLQLKRSVETSTQTGLNNIEQRYLQAFGKKVEIIKNHHFFIVKLPVVYDHSHY